MPCCYGYATAIRHAQGASLVMGCICVDQHRHAAGKGYGYAAVSPFRTRHWNFLYGKLRMTDFLPVGDEKEDEVLARGHCSGSTSSGSDRSGLEYMGGGCFESSSDVSGVQQQCQDGVGDAVDGMESGDDVGTTTADVGFSG